MRDRLLNICMQVMDGGHDLILSVGQIVPHEVAGMANHTKNILVGTGASTCPTLTLTLNILVGTGAVIVLLFVSKCALF